MAELYFIGAVNSLYTEVGNWSFSSGGASSGTTPEMGDTVYLDSNSPNIDIDLGYSIEMAPTNFICTGYSGTVTLSDNFVMVSSGDDMQLRLSPTMILNCGSYYIDFFSMGSPTLTIQSCGKSFGKIYWANFDGSTILEDDLTVTGYIQSRGSFTGNTIYVSGDWYNIGTVSGTSNIVFNGTGNLSSSGAVDLDVTIDTAGTITMHGWMYGPLGFIMGDATIEWVNGTVNGSVLGFSGNTTVISNGHSWGCGTYIAGGTSVVNFADDFISSGDMYLSGTGTFGGDGEITIGGDIRPGTAAGGTLTIEKDITCSGEITTYGGYQIAFSIVLNGAGKNIYCAESIDIYGVSTTITGTATVVLNGTGSIHSGGVSGYISVPINIETSGTITISGSLYYRTGTITYTSGTVTTTSSELVIQSNCGLDTDGMTWNNISVSGASGITLYSDVQCATFAPSATVIFAGDYDIKCSKSLTVGANISGTAGIILNGTGTWSHSSSSYSISNDVTIDTAGTITLSGSNLRYSTGTFKYVSGTVTTTSSDFGVIGSCSLDVSGISFNIFRTTATSTLTLLDNINCASFIVGGETVCSGSHSIVCDGIIIASSLTISDDLYVNGDMSITIWVGSVSSDGKTITITGNLSNSRGASGFVGTSTVVFDGTSTVTGESTFYNLTINPGKTVIFSSGTPQTITNNITMCGEEGSRITLSASTPGIAASLSKAEGVVECSYIDVTDVNVTGGASWYAGSTGTVTNSAGWYSRDPQTSVVFWPPVENFGEYLEVRFIVSEDSNIEIHYTLDGSDPTFSSALYTGPFRITGTTIKARAYDSTGIALGDIYSKTYTAYPEHNPSGFKYEEFYLYSDKQWEMIPSGVSYYNLTMDPKINSSPVVVTSSGYETTSPEDPWAQTGGYGKYTKVGYGYFSKLDSGAFDESQNEYCLVPDASGKLLFNKIIQENVFVEYEGGSDGYYLMDSIDYNPMRNEVAGGFVHFSQVGEPTRLFLTASQDSIIADGYRGCILTATMYDHNFDRVPDKNIIFEVYPLSLLGGLTPASGVYSGVWSDLGYLIPTHGSVQETDASGYAIKVLETTNTRGETHVRYLTHRYKTGVMVIKAWYQDASGVNDIADFSQYWMSVSPFILDISMLDTLDYLTSDIYVPGVYPLGM